MLHRKRTQTGMSVRTDSLERDASVQQVHLSITLHSNIHVHSLVYSHIYRLLHLDHPLMDHCLLDGHFHVLDLQHKPEAPIVGNGNKKRHVILRAGKRRWERGCGAARSRNGITKGGGSLDPDQDRRP